VPHAGHIGILRAPAFLDGVVRELLVEEERTGLDPNRHDDGTRPNPRSLGEAS
jgi:hypothetical protein